MIIEANLKVINSNSTTINIKIKHIYTACVQFRYALNCLQLCYFSHINCLHLIYLELWLVI